MRLLAGAAEAQCLQDAATARDGVGTLVDASLCLGVGLCELEQDGVCGLGVGVVTPPRFERRGLERAAVREGQPPGAVGARVLQGLQAGTSVST